MAEAPPLRVLLVDDDVLFSTAIIDLFANLRVEVINAGSLERARALASSKFDVVILDDRLPDGRGIDLLELFGPLGRPRTDGGSSGGARPRVLVVSADPELDMAIAAVRHHVHDFLPKPVDLNLLEQLVCAARQLPPRSSAVDDASPALDPKLRQFAASDAPVLLRGETGTGKTRLARQLHAASPRAKGPFIALNCGALPEALVESELFGSERGAFTGAANSRPGLIEAAAGGTFFLDEIGELPLACQAKLLDVLETKTLRRIGGVVQRQIDLRFLAATHVDLEHAANLGRFRRDLLYRLDVLRIDLPPLRSRRADLPTLIGELLDELGIDRALGPGELDWLVAQAWLGNVRELRNVLQRAHVLQPDGELSPSRVVEVQPQFVGTPTNWNQSTAPTPVVEDRSDRLEQASLEAISLRHMALVAESSPTRKEAAAKLGIGESTLRRKLKQAKRLGLIY